MIEPKELAVPCYNVLVVDDDIASIEAYNAILAHGHCNVLTATSGDQALRMLLDRDIALVVLDVQMPGTNGFEVAHFMRARAKTRDIPVLFVTAHDHDMATQTRGYDLGGMDFMAKPISGELLLAKVTVLLKLYHSRAQLADANRRLSEERAYFAAILGAATEGILVVDNKGLITYANPAACQLLEIHNADLMHTAFQHRIQGNDGNVIPWEAGVLHHVDSAHRTFRMNDVNLLNGRNETVAVRLSGAPLTPRHDGYVLVFLDNRPTKAMQSQLEQMVITDPLTGLLNRVGFLHALSLAVEHRRRDKRCLAVLYLDLDGFKTVNDTMGHAQGDYLLRRISERLKDCLRAGDSLARIGGDEFTILLDQLNQVEDAGTIAEKLLSAIEAPVQIETTEVTVSASIGIATYPECGDSVDTLLKSADLAMYQAKSDGRSQYRFFTDEMNGRARARFMLQESLRNAINTREFFLQFQPQISLQDGHLRGFEALLRWQHARAGLVSPAVFIPLLEETLLINQVGAWVAAESCRASKRLQKSFGHSLTISVNLSPRQFSMRDLAEHLLHLCALNQLPPGQLEVEVTESTLMRDIASSQKILSKLRSEGVKVALDDFGTGYSSLGYLRQFEIDVLKIDRVFMQNALASQKDAAIVEAIVSLSHILDIEVIAEGVESMTQVRWLKTIGCDYVQGFCFSKPLDEDKAGLFPWVSSLDGNDIES